MRHAVWIYALILLMTLLIACNSDEPAADRGLPRLDIRNSRGEVVPLTVEIADTQDEREHGLSNRETLAKDSGMLFVIPERGPGFWMKDTSIPLSVAFIGACGEIVAIADMQPFSLDVHTTPRPYSFGLEVNQGWFAEHDVAPGSTVGIPDEYRQPACA